MNSWHHLPDLYFLHIPKTAGTSVRDWVEGFFPQDAILPAHHLKRMLELPDEIVQSTRFASGHFGWRFIDRAESLGKNFEVFTFLRDAVKLQISILAYAPTIPDDVYENIDPEVADALREVAAVSQNPRLAAFVADENINVEERLAKNSKPHPGQNNYILHLLAGGAQSEGDLEKNDETTAQAAQRLRDILAVGVVEDMDGSIAILCDRLGLPHLPLGRALNTSEKKLKPSAAYGELVRRRNPYNVRLHEVASDLVTERKADLLAKHGVTDIDQLAAPMRAAFLATDRGVERVGEAEITMADGIVAEGFGPRFFHEPYRRWLRWAGRQATLYLPLDTTGDRRLRFEIATTMNDAIRDGLTLSVNGHDVALTRSYEEWADDAFHLICEGTIPAAAMQPDAQYTALDFAAPEDVETEYPEQMGARAAFALADIRIA